MLTENKSASRHGRFHGLRHRPPHRRNGVLVEGDWLPLVGLPVAQAKVMLKDAGNISYFADAIVNGRQVPVAHVLQPGDRLVFSQRFGVKADDDRFIYEVVGEALVVAYPELLEMAARVKEMNLPADRSRDVLAGMLAEWAEQRFGPPDTSTKAILADIVDRLQRIESALGRRNMTEGKDDDHAFAGVQHAEVMADGPQPPDRFRLYGKEYKDISRDQWLLLKAIWPQRTAKIEDVMEKVYGHNYRKEDEALRSLARRLTNCLLDQSCPAEVVVRSGFCTLGVFDEPKKVASDRPTTG